MECEQRLQSTLIAAPSSNAYNEDCESKLDPATQAQCWDGFHTSHSHGNFFKPRRYILKCFPCILDQCAPSLPDELNDGRANKTRLILEVGCGSGSSCLPILQHCNDEKTVKILACDCSSVAVEVCQSVIDKYDDDDVTKRNFGAFVSDPSLEVDESDTTFVQDVHAAYVKLLGAERDTSTTITNLNEGLADIVLMVFVLSAIPPQRVSRSLQQIYNVIKKGGRVCFRDYALYDLPMMRFKESHCVHDTTCLDVDGVSPRLYERGDGTLSRFFDLETVRHLFEGVGFVVEELRYATVYNDNRKTGERLKRAFVHAVFSKP